MSSQGRKKDPIWINYNQIKVNTDRTDSAGRPKAVAKAECKKCKKQLPILVARMKIHHEKCVCADNSLQENNDQEQMEITITNSGSSDSDGEDDSMQELPHRGGASK